MVLSRVKNRKKTGGFSLYELMVAAAVMSLGLIMVYEAFFIIMDAVGGLPVRMKTQFLIDDIIWEKGQMLTLNGYLPVGEETGGGSADGIPVGWTTSVQILNNKSGLYKCDVSCRWKRGGKKKGILRSAYLRK